MPKNKNSINVGQGGEQSHSSVRIGTAPQPQGKSLVTKRTEDDNTKSWLYLRCPFVWSNYQYG